MMVEDNIKQIRKRHEKEIEDFQNECPHLEVSDWREYHWAPGHFSHYVKVCERCGTTVEEKK